MTQETRKFLASLLFVGALSTLFFVFLFARQKTIMDRLDNADIISAMTSILNNDDHGCVIVRHDSSLVAWNQAMVNLTGYTETEIRRSPLGIKLIMPPELRQKHSDAFADAFKHPTESTVIRADCRLIPKHGNAIPVQVLVWMVKNTSNGWMAIARIDKYTKVKQFKSDAIKELDKHGS